MGVIGLEGFIEVAISNIDFAFGLEEVLIEALMAEVLFLELGALHVFASSVKEFVEGSGEEFVFE